MINTTVVCVHFRVIKVCCTLLCADELRAGFASLSVAMSESASVSETAAVYGSVSVVVSATCPGQGSRMLSEAYPGQGPGLQSEACPGQGPGLLSARSLTVMNTALSAGGVSAQSRLRSSDSLTALDVTPLAGDVSA